MEEIKFYNIESDSFTTLENTMHQISATKDSAVDAHLWGWKADGVGYWGLVKDKHAPVKSLNIADLSGSGTGILKYDSLGDISGGAVISDLADVNISSPVNGQALAWNNTSSRWENTDVNTEGLTYKGDWNANANNPVLVSGSGTKGDYYVVTTAGTTTIDGISSWAVDDWIWFDGSVWKKLAIGTENLWDLSGGSTIVPHTSGHDLNMGSGDIIGSDIYATGTLNVTGTGAIDDISIIGSVVTHRSLSTASLVFSGDTSSTAGFNVVYYGDSHPTAANDCRMRAGTSNVGYYDHSATLWTWTGNTNITNDLTVNGTASVGMLAVDDIRINSNDIYMSSDINFLTLTGGASGITGARMLLYGPSAASAYNIRFTTDTTDIGGYNYSTAKWNWGETEINGDLTVSGDIYANGGTLRVSSALPTIELSETDTTDQNIDFALLGGYLNIRQRNDAFSSGNILARAQASTGNLEFNYDVDITGNLDVIGTGAIDDISINGSVITHRSLSTSFVVFSGDTSSTSGFNITYYGGSHPTNGNDCMMRVGMSNVGYYDYSATLWTWTGNKSITGSLATGGATISAGDVIHQLGDAAGNNFFKIKDYGGVNKLYIDSNALMRHYSDASVSVYTNKYVNTSGYHIDNTDGQLWNNQSSVDLANTSAISIPASTAGHAIITAGGGTGFENDSVIIYWDEDANVFALSGPATGAIIDIGSTAGKLQIKDNGTNVRIYNDFGATLSIVMSVFYTDNPTGGVTPA